ncbi:MAG: hypothetical protein ABL998_00815 [Planctomycetota bacterium]
MKRDRFESWEFFCLVAVLALFILALVGLGSRQFATERRVLALESKPCLMTGAHTGCKRSDQ